MRQLGSHLVRMRVGVRVRVRVRGRVRARDRVRVGVKVRVSVRERLGGSWVATYRHWHVAMRHDPRAAARGALRERKVRRRP